MTPLENNIKATTAACQAIEKQLCENDIPVKQILVLTRNMNDHISALELLSQIKAAVDRTATIIKPENALVKM